MLAVALPLVKRHSEPEGSLPRCERAPRCLAVAPRCIQPRGPWKGSACLRTCSPGRSRRGSKPVGSQDRVVELPGHDAAARRSATAPFCFRLLKLGEPGLRHRDAPFVSSPWSCWGGPNHTTKTHVLSSRSIRAKLLFAFVGVALLCAAVGTFAYSGFNALSGGMKTIYDDRVVPMAQIREIADGYHEEILAAA